MRHLLFSVLSTQTAANEWCVGRARWLLCTQERLASTACVSAHGLSNQTHLAQFSAPRTSHEACHCLQVFIAHRVALFVSRLAHPRTGRCWFERICSPFLSSFPPSTHTVCCLCACLLPQFKLFCVVLILLRRGRRITEGDGFPFIRTRCPL